MHPLYHKPEREETKLAHTTPLLYWDYRRFFDGKKAIHLPMMGAPKATTTCAVPKQYEIIDLDQLFAEHPSDRCFVKLDIERWEYRLLDQLIRHQHRMTGLVIEFHDIILHLDRIAEFIRELKLNVVHIHGSGSVYEQGNPMHLEMSFAPPSEDDRPLDQDVSYPRPELDAPGTVGAKDWTLHFE